MNTNQSERRANPHGATRPHPPDDANAQTRPYWQNAYGARQEPAKRSEPQPRAAPPNYADRLGQLQPIRIAKKATPPSPPPLASYQAPRQRRSIDCGCMSCVVPFFVLVLGVLAVYLLFPLRTNLVIMGIDRAPEGTSVSRTDLIMLMSVIPLQPEVNLLSIPRDLWVDIPGVGQNRINTAHFYAEAAEVGSGPPALQQVIRHNFGVDIPYFVRIRFAGFVSVVEAMGGVTLELSEPMAGYAAGAHRLNGEQALAFARDRAGTDDFFRMQHSQLMLKAMVRQLAQPVNWLRLPLVAAAGMQAVDTNLPVWHWPRIGLALLRAGADGVDSHTITRDMVSNSVTDYGAQVLIPNWERIRPLVQQLFGRA